MAAVDINPIVTRDIAGKWTNLCKLSDGMQVVAKIN
jgi:hypothetical protein